MFRAIAALIDAVAVESRREIKYLLTTTYIIAFFGVLCVCSGDHPAYDERACMHHMPFCVCA